MSSFCDDDLSTGVLLFRYCNLTEAAFIRGDTNAESITPAPDPSLSVSVSPSRNALKSVLSL